LIKYGFISSSNWQSSNLDLPSKILTHRPLSFADLTIVISFSDKKEGQILGRAFAALNDSFNMLGKDDPIRKKAEKMIKAGKLSIYDIFDQHGKDLVEEINKIELYNECLNGLKGVK